MHIPVLVVPLLPYSTYVQIINNKTVEGHVTNASVERPEYSSFSKNNIRKVCTVL